MSISATKALRRLCELKKWTITNLEAQKLLYFGQMIALGKSDGHRPMIDGHFQAWELGPVQPSAYHVAKMFGNKPIKSFIFNGSGAIPEWDPIMEEALENFGDLTSSQLVAESHWARGAWIKHFRAGARGLDIPNADILAEYRARTS